MDSQKKTKGPTNKKIDDYFTSANKRLETSPIPSELEKSLKKVSLAATSPKKSSFIYKGFFIYFILRVKTSRKPKEKRKQV